MNYIYNARYHSACNVNFSLDLTNNFQVEDNNTVWSQGSNAGGPSDVTSPIQTIHLNSTSKGSNSHDNTRKASNTNSLSSQEKDDALTELPQVHSSPLRQIPEKGNEISSV